MSQTGALAEAGFMIPKVLSSSARGKHGVSFNAQCSMKKTIQNI